MAEEDMPADGDAVAATGGRKKLLLIVGVVALIAGGAFVGMQVLGGGGDAAADETPSESEPPPEGEVLDVATMTTTVSGEASLARVGLAIVLAEGASGDLVAPKFPLVEDAAVSELARTEAQTLRTPEGADDLRERLTERAQEIYPDGEVVRVLLTELVVQ